MSRRIAVMLMLGLMPWTALHAQQQTATTTFRVTARVNAVCSVTANDLAFGTYNQQTGVNGTTQLRAVCSPQATYNIGLSEGTSSGATVNQRRMASGANALNYQLYSNSARSTIWGNTPGTDTVTGTGTGLAQDHTVFGAIPATQSIPAGDYADTITVRIYY
jgi:spore coat protein U-like protein